MIIHSGCTTTQCPNMLPSEPENTNLTTPPPPQTAAKVWTTVAQTKELSWWQACLPPSQNCF